MHARHCRDLSHPDTVRCRADLPPPLQGGPAPTATKLQSSLTGYSGAGSAAAVGSCLLDLACGTKLVDSSDPLLLAFTLPSLRPAPTFRCIPTVEAAAAHFWMGLGLDGWFRSQPVPYAADPEDGRTAGSGVDHCHGQRSTAGPEDAWAAGS